MDSWRNRKTLILGRTDMMGLLMPAEYNACVEQAYRMHGEGRFHMEPKGHIVLDKYPGEWEAMPSYIEEPEAAACKWVSIREQNRAKFDLPTVFSILIYTHPETGFPLAICDGSHHTVMRTGSAAAVSAKWLARKDAKRLAIVGAGHMAEGVLATCSAPGSSTFSITDFDGGSFVDDGSGLALSGIAGNNIFTGALIGQGVHNSVAGSMRGSFMQGGGSVAAEAGAHWEVVNGTYEASGIIAAAASAAP